MKVKLLNIIASEKSLSQLATQKLSPRTSFRIASLLHNISIEMESYYKVRKGILEEYGELNDDKQTYKIPSENRQAVEDALNELADTTIDLPGQPISLNDLGDITISPADMLTLLWLITNDKEE